MRSAARTPHCFSAMLKRYVQALHTDDAGDEEPAATRERLRAAFPPNATRRMTQLGLLVGASVGALDPREDDAIIYASSYGESRALESYLDSFPHPSPTLFQTSIHPSGIQQGLIGARRSVREVLPISAGAHLVAHALLAALLAPAERVILCGGEERGTWSLEQGVASDRAFGFALTLTRDAGPSALAAVELERRDPSQDGDALTFAAWFDRLHQRQGFSGPVAPDWQLKLQWS